MEEIPLSPADQEMIRETISWRETHFREERARLAEELRNLREKWRHGEPCSPAMWNYYLTNLCEVVQPINREIRTDGHYRLEKVDGPVYVAVRNAVDNSLCVSIFPMADFSWVTKISIQELGPVEIRPPYEVAVERLRELGLKPGDRVRYVFQDEDRLTWPRSYLQDTGIVRSLNDHEIVVWVKEDPEGPLFLRPYDIIGRA